MEKVIKHITSFAKGLLFEFAKYLILILAIIFIFRDYTWPAGMTFEQWYLKISGCDLNNIQTNTKCLITNPLTCWHCQILDNVWNIMYFLSYRLYYFFSNISIVVMTFAFAFWLLIEMFFKKFGTGDIKFDPQGWWKTVIMKAFKIILAIALIYSFKISGIIKYVVNPAISSSTFFARTVISSVVDIDRCDKLVKNTEAPKFLISAIKEYKNKNDFIREITNNNAVTEYQSNVKNELICIIWNFQTMLLTGISAGANIVQMDWNIFNKLIGVSIIIIFFMLGWHTLIEILEVVISIGFLLLLTPFTIMSWAVGGMFKISKSLVSISFDTLIGITVHMFVYSFSLSVLYLSLYYMIDVSSIGFKKDAFTNIETNVKNQGDKLHDILFTEDRDYINFKDNNKQDKKIDRMPLKKARITSRFGYRLDPISGKKSFHGGIDLAMPEGTPVPAAADGVIEFKNWDENNIYGNKLAIKHSPTYSTVYAHLSKFSDKFNLGSKVKQGEIIGFVGSTGKSTGPHLHYEIRQNGKSINPEATISGTKGFANMLLILMFGLIMLNIFDLIKNIKNTFSIWNIGFSKFITGTLWTQIKNKYKSVNSSIKTKIIKK